MNRFRVIVRILAKKDRMITSVSGLERSRDKTGAETARSLCSRILVYYF